MLEFLKPSWQQLNNEWQSFLQQDCFNRLIKIDKKLNEIAQKETIYPPQNNIFRALYSLAPAKVKIVILGQDPYHGENEANGLAFAVNPGITQPPSLRNIFKELRREYTQAEKEDSLDNNSANSDSTIAAPTSKLESKLLNSWAEQGVLLLNAALTVIKQRPNSLSQIGWHYITDQIIHYVSGQSPACVFMLWGNYARSKKLLVNPNQHLVLEAAHPSPLSANRGFFGCNHFKLANQFLIKRSIIPINWFM